MSGVAKAVGSAFKGVGKAVSSVAKGIGKFVSSDAFKVAAIGAAVFFGGGAMGLWATPLTGAAAGAGAGAGTGAGAGVASGLGQAAAAGAAPQAATGTGILGGAMTPGVQYMLAAETPGAVAGMAGAGAGMAGGGASPLAAGMGGALMPAPGKPSVWEHPAVRMGGGLLAGAMTELAKREALKKEYAERAKLLDREIAARQIHYGGGYDPGPLYGQVIGRQGVA